MSWTRSQKDLSRSGLKVTFDVFVNAIRLSDFFVILKVKNPENYECNWSFILIAIISNQHFSFRKAFIMSYFFSIFFIISFFIRNKRRRTSIFKTSNTEEGSHLILEKQNGPEWLIFVKFWKSKTLIGTLRWDNLGRRAIFQLAYQPRLPKFWYICLPAREIHPKFE